MDDRFLRDLRKRPSPEFAARLRASLRDARPNAAADRAASSVLGKWLAAAASVAVVGFAFTLPSVRAGAEAFLDLFRVVQFTGVRVDPERIRTLASSGLDVQALFGKVEPLTEVEPPASYANAQEAGEAAGIRVRTPVWIPPGYTSTGFTVAPEHAARITVSTGGLRELLDVLALDDVELPADLDGQVATVRVPPIVAEAYANGARKLLVVQSRSPDVSFPAALDLSKLAYAGLRILGTPKDEAYRMSVTIDWRTTMIVPVPPQGASYRSIDVAGHEGLLVEAAAPGGQSVLMWSDGGETFAVAGPARGLELLEIAQTLQ